MKKILVALLVLALVAPAMAVTLSGSDLGGGKMRISYDVPSGEVLRGVALKLSTTVGTATIAGTADVTAIDSFFDVFIDYAFSVPAGFTVTPRVGHPLANPAAAGQLTAFPASTFSLSMGALDETGNQGGVTGTGVLCEIQYTLTADATIKIEADTLRGGAVVGDAVTQPAAIDVVLVGAPPACTVSQPTVVKTTAAPAIATRVNSGRVETFVASATSSLGHGLEYQFTWGDGVVGPWGAANQSHTYTYAAATTYNVTVIARCTSPDASVSIPSAPLALTSESVKSTAAGTGRPAGEAYAAWAQFGRPNCWGFQRSCRGDIDGIISGPFWVAIPDLNTFKSAFSKDDATLATVPNGICADNDRIKSGPFRVAIPDLTQFKLYFSKPTASVPVCPQTNNWYWTN
jgi:hypothetical protein